MLVFFRSILIGFILILVLAPTSVLAQGDVLKFDSGLWKGSKKQDGKWTDWVENDRYLKIDLDLDKETVHIYAIDETFIFLKVGTWEESEQNDGSVYYFNEGVDRQQNQFYLTLYGYADGSWAMHVGYSKFKFFFYMNGI